MALGLMPLAATTMILQYIAPLASEEPTPRHYSYTRFEPGQRVHVADEGVQLRAAADEASATLAELGMGQEVRVRERGKKPVELGGAVNLWYEVEMGDRPGAPRSGFVFGGALTPLAFTADLDGDGGAEVATVSFTADFRVRVRVLKPAARGEGRLMHLDFQPAGEAYLKVRGGEVSAQLVPAQTAGVALLQIDSQREACADFWRTYVSYGAPQPAPERPGRLAAALVLRGVTDPPVADEFEVQFQPASRSAIVVRHLIQQDARGRERRSTRRLRYQLRDGVFVAERRRPTK